MAKRKMSTFERPSTGQMNRAQRRELRRRVVVNDPGLTVVHPNAGGIDVGNASHFVAVPPDRDGNPVREFGCWTAALNEMAEWLKSCRVDTVAMQATGVYWIALYDVLEQHGIRVVLVNARHTKNVPGRKTDVQECQWLMKLHTYGLMRDSFRLQQDMEYVRTIWRVRDRHVHVKEAGRAVQHMQKALTKMNIQLANVISDISGDSGQAIISAVVKGERDPYKLADLADYRVKASREEVARSLRETGGQTCYLNCSRPLTVTISRTGKCRNATTNFRSIWRVCRLECWRSPRRQKAHLSRPQCRREKRRGSHGTTNRGWI
jgi:transposase